MAELRLRDYQTETINAVFDAWDEGLRRPAVVLPTGAGKTVVFAHLIKEFRRATPNRMHPPFIVPGLRVMVLVHRDELADQAIDKIRSIAPDLNVGKVKAQNNDVYADVMVCSVQTLAGKRRRDELIDSQWKLGGKAGPIGLIITDECHHGAAPSYRKIYDAFPDALNLGVTATLQRGDGVGLGGIWDDVVYRKSPLWMMSKGYLADVKARTVKVDMALGDVKKSRGDYQAADLGRALEESHADAAIAKAYQEHASDRPGVVFTPTVSTAHAAAEELNAAGIVTAVVTGETPREERQDIFRRYREGSVQVLSNCMVLTEGFDAPWASCAVIARPTQSEPLYQQMVGRVLRPWPGKDDALVLHLMGAGGTLRTLVDLDPTCPVEAVKDGETLAEAVEREAGVAGLQAPPGSVAFELKLKEHNLFKGSAYAWSKTPAGVLFIGCGDTTVFLWPHKEAGLYCVCTVTKGDKWRQTQYRSLDLSSAMAWGEAVAEDHQAFSVKRSARWRKGEPSEAQVRTASGLGIRTEGLSKGDVSDAIGRAFAASQFDHYAGKILL